MWKELPEDLKMFNKLYYYNVTNYLEVEKSRGQIKPLIEELGPYIWRERHLKENIVWNNGENATRFYTDEDCFVNCERYYEEITTIDNGTVTYQQKKIWEFMEEETLPLTLDDIIVNINMIALVRDGKNFFEICTYLLHSSFLSNCDFRVFLSTLSGIARGKPPSPPPHCVLK